jgi:hypothetical protein
MKYATRLPANANARIRLSVVPQTEPATAWTTTAMVTLTRDVPTVRIPMKGQMKEQMTMPMKEIQMTEQMQMVTRQQVKELQTLLQGSKPGFKHALQRAEYV